MTVKRSSPGLSYGKRRTQRSKAAAIFDPRRAGQCGLGPNDDLWINPLIKKIRRPLKPEMGVSVCAWCDLRGVGDVFRRSNWHPSGRQWKKLLERVNRAYLVHARHYAGFGEYLLMLNDGIVRAWSPVGPARILGYLALWLRAVVWAHLDLNKLESDMGLPGARTVISAGVHARYAFGEVRFDDLILNYSRTKKGISLSAEAIGNPQIISNPIELQMNTAFSRSYILDSLGSAGDLGGAELYVDGVLLDYIKSFIGVENRYYSAIERRRRDGDLFAVAYSSGSKETPWCFGFLFDPKRVPVETRNLRTEVLKLRAFYPHDEHPEKFCFDLANPSHHVVIPYDA